VSTSLLIARRARRERQFRDALMHWDPCLVTRYVIRLILDSVAPRTFGTSLIRHDFATRPLACSLDIDDLCRLNIYGACQISNGTGLRQCADVTPAWQPWSLALYLQVVAVLCSNAKYPVCSATIICLLVRQHATGAVLRSQCCAGAKAPVSGLWPNCEASVNTKKNTPARLALDREFGNKSQHARHPGQSMSAVIRNARKPHRAPQATTVRTISALP